MRWLFGLVVLVFRGAEAKDAELLVLRHENAVLRRHASRVRYEPADRLWLAALARLLPPRRWTEIFPVTPPTPTARSIARVAVRLAKENPLQGYRRIHGELTRPGLAVAPSTVWEILHAAGIDPAPRRTGPTWRQFLHAQAAGILVADFLHVDTVLLNRLYALIFIEHGTRRMHLGGVTASHRRVDGAAGPQPRPHPRRAVRGHQIPDPRPRVELHHLVRAVFQATGARILCTAVQAPRMNATCERLAGTLSREFPGRVLILGEAHLRAVPSGYQAHYNTARPHQGIAQRVPDDEPDAHHATLTDVGTRQIRRKPVLNGLINEYARAA